VFVTGKPLQLSLVFVGKTRACPIDAPLYGKPLALPTNSRLDWNGLPGTNTSLSQKFVNYGQKSFITLVPGATTSIPLDGAQQIHNCEWSDCHHRNERNN
jgi:hypothetical protein